MKRFIIIVLFFLNFNLLLVYCQEKDENEVTPPKTKISKIGGAGGFTAFWLFANVDHLNDYLIQSNAQPLDKNGFPLFGGQGYGYIMLIENLRVGGIGAGGSIISKNFNNTTNITRKVELSTTFGGVTIEYVIPLFSRLDIAIGTMVGWGGLDIKITRDSGKTKTWKQLFDEFGSLNDASEYSRQLSGSFFTLLPSINIEYAILRWLGLRTGISYLSMLNGDWTLDENFEILGVPNQISSKGWMINTGIFLGTFIY